MSRKAIIDGVERYAIWLPPNTVRCDAPGCCAETYVERYPHHYGDNRDQHIVARAEAAGRGWTYRDGLDLCPEHSAERKAR